MRSRPIHQLLHLRRNPIRPVVLPSHPISVRSSLAPTWTPSSSTQPSPLLPSTASFHTSPRHQNERSNLPPQSPFKVFVQTLKEEIQKNRELQEDVKKLQGDVDKFADSEAMKKAREAYERSRIVASIKENPKLRAAAEEMKRQGLRISDGVSDALQQVEDSEFMRQLTKTSAAISQGVTTATAPVRNTAAYKALSESVVEAFEESSRYGGYEDKEVRRKRREERLKKAGLSGKRKRVEANPEAGEALVLSSTQEPEDTWSQRLKRSEAYQRWQEQYYESENPVVSTLRSVTSTVGGWFEENETARVIRMIRALDPDFQMEAFQRELREYIVPEVVDAYLNADKESLKMWCGEATYNMLWATMEQYLKQGLVSDSRVLDIRSVDISTGKILENDVPVFLVTFATQEILLFRSAKDGKVVVGRPDGVESVVYAAVLTLEESELDNTETGGWKVMEMARRGGA